MNAGLKKKKKKKSYYGMCPVCSSEISTFKIILAERTDLCVLLCKRGESKSDQKGCYRKAHFYRLEGVYQKRSESKNFLDAFKTTEKLNRWQ